MTIDEDAAIRVLAELSRESHVTREALRQFLTDSLDSVESAARVKLHLSSCEECQEALADEAATLDVEPTPEADTETASCEKRLLGTLPALTALLQGRQQHITVLSKLVLPEEVHWKLPSFLKTVDSMRENRVSEEGSAEEFYAAAFSEAGRMIAPQYLKNFVRVVQFVEEMEDALASQWNEVQLEEPALATLLDACICASSVANEWPSVMAEQVRKYYVRVMLPGSDVHSI
jgi:hypothetical protein